jgi:hypothetical protein
MAGLLINLVPKRVFDFGPLITGQVQSLVLAERINILQYCDGILVVRVHSVSLDGGNMALQLLPDGYTSRDPQIFQGAAGSYYSPGIIISGGPSFFAGMVLCGASVAGQLHGEYAMLVIQAARTIDPPAPVTATLSIDLVLRSPDDIDNLVPTAVEAAGGCRCDE